MSTAIIIVTHQSADHIDACLDAITPQLGPGDHVVVVDNGSTDATRDRLAARDDRHVAVVLQDNVGFGAGCNRGAAFAADAWPNMDTLVFVNPDTVAEPGWLEGLVAATGPGRLATSKVVLAHRPDHVNVCGLDVHWTGIGYVRGLGAPIDVFDAAEEVTGVGGSSFAITRADWDRLGGFDPGFFLYLEDADLSWRAARAGMRMTTAPASVIRHHYAVTGHPDKLRHFVAGRVRLLRRHLRLRHWLLLWPSLLVTDVVLALAALRHGRRGVAAYLAGTWRGWRQPCGVVPSPPWTLQLAARRARLADLVPRWLRPVARLIAWCYRVNAAPAYTSR